VRGIARAAIKHCVGCSQHQLMGNTVDGRMGAVAVVYELLCWRACFVLPISLVCWRGPGGFDTIDTREAARAGAVCSSAGLKYCFR
jgi:hypothetical protein